LSDGRDAQMSVTSVSGHILVTEFDSAYGWGKCEPGDLFFTAPVQKMVPQVSAARAATDQTPTSEFSCCRLAAS